MLSFTTKPPRPAELVTLRDASAMLSLSLPTLRRMIARAELRPVQVGRVRRVLVRRTDLDALIARGMSRDPTVP